MKKLICIKLNVIKIEIKVSERDKVKVLTNANELSEKVLEYK